MKTDQTQHPEWCNSTYCNAVRGAIFHQAIPQQWRVDDSEIRLELWETDEPGIPGDGPRVSLGLITPPGLSNSDPAILTPAETVDLIRRLQSLIKPFEGCVS
ncbi:MAG: hypothetical protein ACRDQH_07985 [Pseudonocardiaceae bacterium]